MAGQIGLSFEDGAPRSGKHLAITLKADSAKVTRLSLENGKLELVLSADVDESALLASFFPDSASKEPDASLTTEVVNDKNDLVENDEEATVQNPSYKEISEDELSSVADKLCSHDEESASVVDNPESVMAMDSDILHEVIDDGCGENSIASEQLLADDSVQESAGIVVADEESVILDEDEEPELELDESHMDFPEGPLANVELEDKDSEFMQQGDSGTFSVAQQSESFIPEEAPVPGLDDRYGEPKPDVEWAAFQSDELALHFDDEDNDSTPHSQPETDDRDTAVIEDAYHEPLPDSATESEPESSTNDSAIDEPVHEKSGYSLLEDDLPPSDEMVPPAVPMIRFTCPRCSTVGVQSSDRVGAVVTCQTCGKAMRLTLKP